jgi:hypothetical protein
VADVTVEQSLQYLHQSLTADGFETLVGFYEEDAATLRYIYLNADRSRIVLVFVDGRYVGLDIGDFPSPKWRKLVTLTVLQRPDLSDAC